MSKTPFTREHRETLEQLLQDWDIQGYAAEAVRAALEHLPKPEPEPLPDGPYLYSSSIGDITVRFVFGGQATGWTTDHMDGPGVGSYSALVQPEDRHRYEPIAIIRGDGGEVPADLVERVFRRVRRTPGVDVSTYAVRKIMQAILDEVRG